MSKNKRKRQEEEAQRPAKKPAIAAPKGNVKVQHVQNNDIPGPILANTPGLAFPSKIAFKPYKKTKILPAGESTELLLQSSEHPRLDYTACEEKDGSSESQLRDYVGVYDPATGKLQLMPVRRLTVRSTLRSETEALLDKQARMETAKLSNMAKRHALAAEFGSKKSRKAIEDLTVNAISRGKVDESVADSILQGMSSITSAMPTKEDLAAAVDSSKPRPLANISAEYPEDVYSTDVVVGKELIEFITVKDWVDASEAGTGVQVGSKFVAKHILKLVKNKQVQKLKVLRFILLCVNFYNALGASKGKGARRVPPKEKLTTAMGDDVSETVTSGIRRKFVSENNDMPRWHIDNLMTHICAAALIVDNFYVDVNDLRDDLKLDNKEIRQYFAELGCRVAAPTETDRTTLKITKAESNNHYVAKLKLPLVFPKIRTGPSKGRR